METLSMRIVFDHNGKTKKDPTKKGMIHIEVRDRKTNKKTYIPTNVKVFEDQYSKNSLIINPKKHPNATVLSV